MRQRLVVAWLSAPVSIWLLVALYFFRFTPEPAESCLTCVGDEVVGALLLSAFLVVPGSVGALLLYTAAECAVAAPRRSAPPERETLVWLSLTTCALGVMVMGGWVIFAAVVLGVR